MPNEYKKYVVNCKTDQYDVYIGRPSKFGNPFSHRHGTQAECVVDTREEAIECFKNYLFATPKLLKAVRMELKNKILGCHCGVLQCHGEILAEIANSDEFVYLEEQMKVIDTYSDVNLTKLDTSVMSVASSIVQSLLYIK